MTSENDGSSVISIGQTGGQTARTIVNVGWRDVTIGHDQPWTIDDSGVFVSGQLGGTGDGRACLEKG